MSKKTDNAATCSLHQVGSGTEAALRLAKEWAANAAANGHHLVAKYYLSKAVALEVKLISERRHSATNKDGATN